MTIRRLTFLIESGQVFLTHVVSRWYGLAVVLAIFVIQSGFIAVVQDGWRSEDEQRLFGLAQLFAQQPIWQGPFNLQQDLSSIWIGAVEHTSSYLYLYIVSIPLRLLEWFGLGSHWQLVVMRLFTIAIGAAGLYLYYLIARQLKLSAALSTVATFVLSVTPIFVYMSALVNYDIPSLTLMLLLCYLCLKIWRKHVFIRLLLSLSVVLLVSITKNTYMPIAVIMWLTTAVAVCRTQQFSWVAFITECKTALAKPGLGLVAAILLLCLSVGLFIERVGVNLVLYHGFNQSCTDVFSQQECKTNLWAYKRNTDQKQYYAEQKSIGNFVDYSLIGYSGEWLDEMFNTIYYYPDRLFGQPAYWVRAIEAMTLGVVLIVFWLYGRSLRGTSEMRLIVFWSLVYIGMVYIFNLNTYLTLGAKYAYHGRYVLFSLALLYLPLMELLKKMRHDDRRVTSYAYSLTVLLASLFLLVHMPVWQYWSYAGYDWYYAKIAKDIPIIYFDNPLIKLMRN